jgi:hypothetical protein
MQHYFSFVPLLDRRFIHPLCSCTRVKSWLPHELKASCP